MADLTPLQALQRIITRELPGTHASVDQPESASGSWFLDLEWNGATAVVEWRPAEGFGVGGDDAGYGEGPEFVTTSVEEAARTAVDRLRTSHIPMRADRAGSR